MEEQNQTQELSSYEQEMVAKAEEAALLPAEDDFATPEETPLLAGKYKSAEELEKAYKALESKLGTPREVVEEGEAREVVESVGIDFALLNDEYAENGALSAETYQELANAGIPQSTVDSYIAGQQALVEQNISRLQALAGGEQSYDAMIEWASNSLSDIEKEGFNQALATEAGSQFAIQGLYARYKADAAEPNLVRGSASTSSSAGYESSRQMMNDMASPKYRNDPAFRQMVQSKVARSNF